MEKVSLSLTASLPALNNHIFFRWVFYEIMSLFEDRLASYEGPCLGIQQTHSIRLNGEEIQQKPPACD